MKKIIKNIYLTWRTGKGGRRIPIGRIKKNSTEGITFSYLKRNVEEAQKKGFVLFEGFPDIDKIYSSNVLDIFGHRLIKNERTDSKFFYEFWMIEPDKREDKYYLLAMTQGLVPTDNFEFLADFYPANNLCFITEISGLSNAQIESSFLNDNDTLESVLERENEYDKYAVALYKEGKKLGYVKSINSKVFYHSKYTPKVTVHSVEKNGVLKRVFIKVKFQ
ncbi:hypothetical protein M2T28_03805 [Elizabethkingia miricola]|uniref:HIRAN domain-containing protein n=1 Tax=Elizabethkingia miricola TaxID=172045 RepID=UPI002018CCA9|nr:HIRAN domain-containing protein [Elizabethkingia miricola]MDV3460250.1 hypothetical protein [Elizabethkingia anophelis]MCL1651720.1 hypothetical protein [Elizabethkingia miricola]MDV3777115.1 hypothetical protein [Elizabethkingia anophelis]MDV3788676.1 hypothetical protein [Elizabethkingia anophelis]MDV3841542.1 hypothetical protein [Elizabethkingia anophelis]